MKVFTTCLTLLFAVSANSMQLSELIRLGKMWTMNESLIDLEGMIMSHGHSQNNGPHLAPISIEEQGCPIMPTVTAVDLRAVS